MAPLFLLVQLCLLVVACGQAGRSGTPLLDSTGPLISRWPDFEVVLQISPGTAGLNHYDVYLEDFSRDDPQVRAVDLSFRYLDFPAAPITASGRPVHPDHFALDGDELPHAGRWSIEVTVKRDRQSDIVAPFRVFVPPSTPTESGGTP